MVVFGVLNVCVPCRQNDTQLATTCKQYERQLMTDQNRNVHLTFIYYGKYIKTVACERNYVNEMLAMRHGRRYDAVHKRRTHTRYAANELENFSSSGLTNHSLFHADGTMRTGKFDYIQMVYLSVLFLAFSLPTPLLQSVNMWCRSDNTNKKHTKRDGGGERKRCDLIFRA